MFRCPPVFWQLLCCFVWVFGPASSRDSLYPREQEHLLAAYQRWSGSMNRLINMYHGLKICPKTNRRRLQGLSGQEQCDLWSLFQLNLWQHYSPQAAIDLLPSLWYLRALYCSSLNKSLKRLNNGEKYLYWPFSFVHFLQLESYTSQSVISCQCCTVHFLFFFFFALQWFLFSENVWLLINGTT